MLNASTGRLALEELRQHAADGSIDTVIAAFPDMYGRLVGKRFTARYFLETVANHGTHGCNYLLAADIEMDPTPGYALTSWERGYGDFHLSPDLQTLRHAAWLERTAIVLCNVDNEDHTPVRVAPRSILQEQVMRLTNYGYTAKAACELEFYIFKDSFEQAQQKQYASLAPFGSYIEDYHILQGTKSEPLLRDLRNLVDASGIPVESSKGEWGAGQQEVNLLYSDVLEQADRTVLYKHAAKEIALSHDLAVTFMAKYDENCAGSSMHVHLSLWQADQPLFPGEDDFHGLHASDTFRQFLAGWMKYAPELAVMYAPTINSYKRFQAASFAPTRMVWSIDNRTTAFRIAGHGNSLRIEFRMPGADANPYLSFAAAIAAGLRGIEDGLEPLPMFSGDAYAQQDLPQVPRTLREAIALFERSDFARETFGEDVHAHYLHFFKSEQAYFDRAVTTWERARYFERI